MGQLTSPMFQRVHGKLTDDSFRAMQESLEKVLFRLSMQEDINTPRLLNGWGNYGGGTSNAGFWKDSTGIVHLSGKVTGGSLSGAAIFVLPSGYRPASLLSFPSVSATSGGAREVEVGSDGVVSLPTAVATPYVTLDGISFRAGQ